MSRLPETGPSLRRFLQQQKRQAGRAANSSPFTRSGSGVTAVDEVTYEGVLKILGQMVVDGTLTVNGPTALDGDTTVGGAMAITGTLSLPAGIIDNDALTSPIEIAADAGNADGFTVTTTDTGFITFTIPIPAGYTQALVKAEGMIWVYNASTVGDYLFTCLYVDSPSTSTHSRDLLGDLNPTSGISLTITKQTVFTGLAGGVITIRQRAGTTYASMYHASNAMTATASVWFLR